MRRTDTISDAAQPGAVHPPCVRFGLNVGITGHRAEGLADAAALAAELDQLLTDIRMAALALHAREARAFAATPPALVLVSPLADGADQVAASRALAQDFALHAVLPFARDTYRHDFADGATAADFDALLARAERVLELPGDRAHPKRAYSLAGRATIAHADLLIAVWDGLPARGLGGTAEVVEQALRRGVPVIHMASQSGRPLRLIWSAHDPHMSHSHADEISAHVLDRARLDTLLTALLSPPETPDERAHLSQYLTEPERRWQLRTGYPLMLALTGVRRLGPIRAKRYTPDGTGPGEAAYVWADRLASHFAQVYRSGHVFNFVFSAVAVLLGLSGLVLPSGKLWLALAELSAILLFVLNTRVGVARGWHRRWLDYRQMAERLRPFTCLAATGLAQPDLRPGHGPKHWVDWYAAGVWRAEGLESRVVSGDVPALARGVADHELLPQTRYHRGSADAMHRLDHRLHLAGMAVFALSCLSCAGFIIAYLSVHAWTLAHAAGFVGLSAGLPAVGTALFGIRVQGDFAGTAARSGVTADRLDTINAALAAERGSLSRVADLAEGGARAMLADLGEWRLSHQQRRLELP